MSERKHGARKYEDELVMFALAHARAAVADRRSLHEVASELARDITSGELYLFTNARRQRAKVLLFDGTGLAIYMKRLDKGQFAKLWAAGNHILPMTMSELALFLEGSEFVGRPPLSPNALTREELAPKIDL